MLRSLAVCALALALCGTAAAAQRPALVGRDVFTGKPLSLAQFGGRAVFVNFWGSWCEGCKAEARTLARFARAHSSQAAFLGVDVIDSRAGAKAFYARYDTEYPSIADPRGLLGAAWTRGTPTTLVFNRRHQLVQRLEGPATTAELALALKRATRP